ncbi:MAG: hypothetical protein H6828_00710 [Planctomycetes bacterium]|nr:hypothetical protein [Planctomycetota bacterium]
MKRAYATGRKRGMTILELLVCTSLLATILLSVFAVIERDTHLARSTLGIAVAETKAQQMLRDIEAELADARGTNPIAQVTMGLGSGSTAELVVDSTLGFPDEGTLLLERGTANEERLSYNGLGGGGTRFLNLVRGLQCTQDATHATGVQLLWSGLAEPIALQTNPPAASWDGRALEATGPVFFRGDGTGFSYRVPVDPTGANPPNYLNDDDELRWGHDLGGPTEDAWACLYFVAKTSYDESATGDDLNRDGDTNDVFDIGQIRRRIWNTVDPAAQSRELGLGPSNVMQERCNWGGDLDGDGFDDPLFLWDREARRLHVRLFILGRTNADVPIVRQVQSLVFLRNEPEN